MAGESRLPVPGHAGAPAPAPTSSRTPARNALRSSALREPTRTPARPARTTSRAPSKPAPAAAATASTASTAKPAAKPARAVSSTTRAATRGAKNLPFRGPSALQPSALANRRAGAGAGRSVSASAAGEASKPLRGRAAGAGAGSQLASALGKGGDPKVAELALKMDVLLARYDADRERNEQEISELKAQVGSSSSMAALASGPSVGEVQLQAQLEAVRENHRRDRDDWSRELERVRAEASAALDQQRQMVTTLQSTLTERAAGHLALETQVGALRAQADVLRVELGAERDTIVALRAQLAQADALVREKDEELLAAERLRRKLHNQVQELRGNIRVVARVRPAVQAGSQNNGEGVLADLRYPEQFPREGRELQLVTVGESASGTPTSSLHSFAFDRVFPPQASQIDVFGEVEQLAQSVLDGYNTCIFAYGQTGSGKTYTLEGPPRHESLGATVSSASDPSAGLIPRTVHMLWSVAEQLQARGWSYAFSGQMVEIYLDGIIDLLSTSGSEDPAGSMGRHEIRHDSQRGQTRVEGAEVVELHSPDQVLSLLARAQTRRQVAATAMNARSSRSHSVFTLTVHGRNGATGEATEAVLNLVDLAGSERLSNSGSADDPSRLREAQSINKSLSALGDVIAALGKLGSRSGSAKGEQHVPYRNSTLTWLLKNSLGGNSKTYVPSPSKLMLLNLSPLAEHQNETLCSLRFATKVNATQIGTARRTVRVEQ